MVAFRNARKTGPYDMVSEVRLWYGVSCNADGRVQHGSDFASRNELTAGGNMNLNANTCRNLASACMACAAISLFFGGMLLDLVGLVIGFIAYSKARKLYMDNKQDESVESALKRARLALIFCAIAAAVNLVAGIVLAPTVVM